MVFAMVRTMKVEGFDSQVRDPARAEVGGKACDVSGDHRATRAEFGDESITKAIGNSGFWISNANR